MNAKAKKPAEPEAVETVAVVAKTNADIEACDFDNEHADGVHCALTFRDGTTATGSAPAGENLQEAQAQATAAALGAA